MVHISRAADGAGGTLDLITPPIDEQLGLLASLGRHPSSRALIVEGASHFSAIRIASPSDAERAEDLFQLGEELVGVQPRRKSSVSCWMRWCAS